MALSKNAKKIKGKERPYFSSDDHVICSCLDDILQEWETKIYQGNLYMRT
jgi:hypothetical protein